MGFGLTILNVFANLNLALIDLFILEILIMILFHIDKAGNVKVTFDWIFGISKSRKTEVFVFPFILIGLIYFFTANFFQDKIIKFFINYFGYSLIPLFISLLGLVVFFVSFVIVGRKFNFRLCRPYLIASSIFLFVVIFWLIIKHI